MKILLEKIFFASLFIFCISTNAFANSDPSYDIKARFDVGSKRLEVDQTVTFVNDTGIELDEIHFNIYANKNFLPSEMNKVRFYQNYFKANVFPNGIQKPDFNISEVTSNGYDLKFDILGEYSTSLVLKLKKTLGVNESIKIDIKFDLTVPNQFGLLGYYRDVFYFGHWYPVLSVYKDGRWHDNPLGTDHQPYFFDIADFNVELTIDSSQVIAHGGELLREEKVSESLKKVFFKADNVRDFTFSSSSIYQVKEKDVNGVDVRLYYLPYDADVAEFGFEYACSAMEFYQKKIGQYPYKQITIAETHIGWLGNEFSNIIFIDSRGFNVPDILYRHLDFLISHEMAHQWFYLLVGSDQFSETWMDEAFAVFYNTFYLESKYGRDDNYLALPKWAQILPNTSFREARTQSYVSNALSDSDEVILQPIDEFENSQHIFTAAYNKGAWVLDMLKYRLGNELFEDVMKSYVADFKYKIADVDDFIGHVNKKSGQDLSHFFNDWLKTTKKCDYGVAKIQNNYFEVENYADIVMPVEIKVECADGKEFEYEWDGEGDRQAFSLDKDCRIKKVIVDPEHNILDYNMKNNSSPTKKQIRYTPFYVQLYDFPLLNDSDSYSATAGILLNVFNGGLRLAGRRDYEYNSYIETRYDFHHKETNTFLGHEFENVVKDINLAYDFRYDKSVDSPERFITNRFSIKKKMGPTVYALDKIENNAIIYYEFNKEHDLDRNRFKRNKIGFERNIDYRILSWDPVGGLKFKFNIENSGQYLDSNSDFTKSELDLRLYTPIGFDSQVFANRLNLAVSHGDVEGKERFSLGGRNDLRGFSDKRYKDKNRLIYSSEYRFNIIDEQEESLLRNFFTFNRFNAAVFYDAGLVWDRQIHSDMVKQDIGIGFRFEITVLGFFEKTLNRFDIAFPVDGKDKDNDGVRIWFDITHSF